MTLKVLQSYAENEAARAELSRRGIGYWPERPDLPLHHWLLRRAPLQVGELNKSWDVLETTRLIEEHLPLEAPVLDLGAYASEILCCLHRLGYRSLQGLDLNPNVRWMPYRHAIRYRVADMMATGLPEASLAAVIAISAIEHGIALEKLVRETARILRPGGLLIASTDYWPEKIDTSGVRMFGQAWTIFSRDDLLELFALAGRHGFAPLGECRFEARDAAIEAAGKRYTFAWMALVRR